jgi:DNA-binding NarL/FixJ family response regulator
LFTSVAIYASVRRYTVSGPKIALWVSVQEAEMGQIGKTTLVIATAVRESRRCWCDRLQGTFAICEVAERKALEQVTANLKPAVLVVDLALPQFGRVWGLPHIQRLSPSTKTLALTDTPAENEAISALTAGAKGYYARTIDPAQLKKAVEAMQKGEMWIQRRFIPSLVAEIVSLQREKDCAAEMDRLLDGLTARQRLVADLISVGASNKEIASRLNIAERTVKAHLTETFRNLGVSDRLHLALRMNGYARPLS